MVLKSVEGGRCRGGAAGLRAAEHLLPWSSGSQSMTRWAMGASAVAVAEATLTVGAVRGRHGTISPFSACRLLHIFVIGLHS